MREPQAGRLHVGLFERPEFDKTYIALVFPKRLEVSHFGIGKVSCGESQSMDSTSQRFDVDADLGASADPTSDQAVGVGQVEAQVGFGTRAIHKRLSVRVSCKSPRKRRHIRVSREGGTQ